MDGNGGRGGTRTAGGDGSTDRSRIVTQARRPDPRSSRRLRSARMLCTALITGTLALGAAGVAGAETPADAPDKGPCVYLANNSADNVSVIHPSTKVAQGIDIAVGDRPVNTVASPDGAYVYVLHQGNPAWQPGPTTDGTLSVIDTATDTVVGTITVGYNSLGLAVTPDGKYLYASATATSAYANFFVKVIDVSIPATPTVTTTIPVGFGPYGVAISPDGTTAYVANYYGVQVIDTATNAVVGATIAVGTGSGSGPLEVQVSPDGKYLYTTLFYDNAFAVVDTTTKLQVASIPVGNSPFGLDISPDGKTAWVTNQADDTVSVIDTATPQVTDTITVGDLPTQVELSPDGKTAWVANLFSDNLSVIDTTTKAVTPVASGTEAGPYDLVFAGDACPAPAPAPSGFDCATTPYFHVINGRLFGKTNPTGAGTVIGGTTSNFNAMAFDAASGTLYAYRLGKLINITPDGITDLGAVTNLPGGTYLAGDIDPTTGRYYIGEPKKGLFSVDLTTRVATRVQLPSGFGLVGRDIVIRDGWLWTVDGNGRLKGMNLSTKAVKSYSTPASGGIGAMWQTGAGQLTVWRNGTGDYFRISGVGGAKVVTERGPKRPVAAVTDGANCRTLDG
jgi:YVTN family beta-propeller protein